MEQIQGMLSATGRRVALVAGRFNDLIVSRLIEGAVDCFLRHDGDEKNLTLVRVPGSLEIPLVAGRLAATGDVRRCRVPGRRDPRRYAPFRLRCGRDSKGIASESLRTGQAHHLRCADLRYAGAGPGARRGQERQQGMGRHACRAGDGGPHAAPGLTIHFRQHLLSGASRAHPCGLTLRVYSYSRKTSFTKAVRSSAAANLPELPDLEGWGDGLADGWPVSR